MGFVLGRNKNGIAVCTRHPRLLPFFQAIVFGGSWCCQIIIQYVSLIGIDFIKNHQRWLVDSSDIAKQVIDRFDMLLKIRMGNIHHMQQHISFVDLIESTFKRLHKLGREFANKSDRVTQQKGQVTHHHFSHRGIEGSKEFVFGKDFTLA